MAQIQHILCPRCHKPSLRRARFCQHCGHDMVLNNPGPRYYITRIIKEGGQGAVYETIGDDGRVYAVKEMLDRFSSAEERDEAIKRFDAEAQTLQRLVHPRIPRVYAAFEDEGRHYLAMDFVHGEDLEEVIEREGAIPEPRVLDWAEQICDVLGYLHDNGLIYRDMKPSNIMLDHQHGGIKLVDFGIAKVLQPSLRGTQIGTPGYAPPEQYQGFATRESDMYALGATLHHLLTGRDPQSHPPFTFPAVRDLNPAVSQRTSDAIRRALQMRPEDRFRTVAEFRAALGLAPPVAPAAPAAKQPASAPAAAPAAPPAKQPAATPAAMPAAPAAKQPAAAPAAPPAKQPRTQPVPAPPSVQPRPAAPPTPDSTPAAAATAAYPRPGAAPQAAPAPRRAAGIGAWALGLALVGLVVAALVLLFPDLLAQIGLTSTSPTPQVFISQPFTTENMEIIAPAGTSEEAIRRAFTTAFTRAAQARFGAGVRVQEETLRYTSPPQPIGDDERGTKYRASMEGTVLVPEP